MKPTIKMIEDLSLNAWPSHQIQLYDGWLLRFSYFYTHRTNCVEQIGPSSIPIEEKINFCEDAYHRWGTPSIFKITPLLPDDFEKRLIDRRYAVQHVTEVMTLDLAPWQITMPPECWPRWRGGAPCPFSLSAFHAKNSAMSRPMLAARS